MNIAGAQIQSFKGDIEKNIAHHLKWVNKAIELGVDLLVFPELSLTGYEPTLAKELALDLQDPRLDIFQERSDEHLITIGIGAPILSSKGIHISLVFFHPHQVRSCYSKQYLHPDEEAYFVPAENRAILEVGKKRIALAICYEISVEAHLEEVLSFKPDGYIASTAKDAQGVEKAHRRLAEMAQVHSFPTLFVNGVGPSDDFVSAGRSTVWDEKGNWGYELDSSEEGLLSLNISSNLDWKY